jgi:hypothetical protein
MPASHAGEYANEPERPRPPPRDAARRRGGARLRRLARRLSALAITTALLLAGCGGGDDDSPAGGGSSGSGDTSAQAAAYERAVDAMANDEYDSALSAMEQAGDYRDAPERLEEFRAEAARETLANARRKLQLAPRAALSLALVAQRYDETPAGAAFVERARRAHAAFKRSGSDDLDQGK